MNLTLGLFIAAVTLLNVLACWWLIRWVSSKDAGDVAEHVWDEDLREQDNPLPLWWRGLFVATILFSLGYLVLYPGLGAFDGLLGWTEIREYEEEMAAANEKYGPIFARFAGQSVADLSRDPEAAAVGQRLFVTYCAQCHGSDGRGGPGFPNLADGDWQWGGEPETIKKTILDGRRAVMPGWGRAIGPEGVTQVAAYVRSLAGGAADPEAARAGQAIYQTRCVMCHQADGSGNPLMGARRLTSGTWLYGGSPATIEATIRDGRTGVMPAHREFLGEDKVHVLAAYVYGLSRRADGS